eukprot:scaffold8592_cov105-Phaeocystis_antarctica.AAC.1
MIDGFHSLQSGFEVPHRADQTRHPAHPAQGTHCGRVTCVTTPVNGKPMRLVSAYAPSTGALRPHFFTSILAPHLSKRTILSIDANCVPDVVLDTVSAGRPQPRQTDIFTEGKHGLHRLGDAAQTDRQTDSI